MFDPIDRVSDNPRIARILNRLRDSTPGPLRRDCGNRIFMDDADELQIGEAFSEGDARLWKNARDDILYLLGLIELLMTGMTPYRLLVLRRVMLGHGEDWLIRPVNGRLMNEGEWRFRDGAVPEQADVAFLVDVGFLAVQRVERGDRLFDSAKITKSGRSVLDHATFN